MRYCGNCGAQLDARTLAAGRCPSCGVLLSPSGDPIGLAPPSDHMMPSSQAGANRPTLPDALPDAPLDRPTSPVKWPWGPGGPQSEGSRGARLMMRLGGVLLLLLALALCCADIAILSQRH